MIPTDILEAAKICKLKNFQRLFRIILPAIFPFYLTGLITAAGGAWNASILGEIITWGNTTLAASGLGSYITKNTIDGNFPLVALGIIVMSTFVIIINQFIWKPLHKYASIRFRLD
jgi:NitT/TauT family transport system permease protein